MNLLVVIIVGGIVGWVASAITGRSDGILGSVAIGIVGSIIGSILASFIDSSSLGYFTISWPGLLWAFIGAVLFAATLNALHHNARHSA